MTLFKREIFSYLLYMTIIIVIYIASSFFNYLYKTSFATLNGLIAKILTEFKVDLFMDYKYTDWTCVYL